MRHRQVDRADAGLLGHPSDPAREPHRRLRPSDDFDLLPREGACNAEAERLADGFLPRETTGIALCRVRSRVAVRLLRRREAACAEARVALERAADARDLDQIRADANHRCASSHSGSWLIEETIPSGCDRARSTVSGRNLPVRTSTVRRPVPCAPAMSVSTSSPTIQVMCGSASSASHAAAKYAELGLPSTVASTCAAYSRPTTKAPESSIGPCFVCHQRLRCRQYRSAPASSSAQARARFMYEKTRFVSGVSSAPPRSTASAPSPTSSRSSRSAISACIVKARTRLPLNARAAAAAPVWISSSS